jgi:hypothetical protein
MTTTPAKPRLVVGSALATGLSLIGGLLLGGAVGELVFNLLPGHSTTSPSVAHMLLAAAPALLGMLAGSAGWGLWIGRLAGAPDQRRMAVAGAAGFAPITIVLGLALSMLEPIAVEKLGAQFPIARLFTFFFVPTAFLIAGVGAWAIGIGLKDKRLAWSLGWRAGLAAAITFLIVNLLMEMLGWRVGAPDASKRATMLTVMLVSNLGAALAAGAAIGVQISRRVTSGAVSIARESIMGEGPA